MTFTESIHREEIWREAVADAVLALWDHEDGSVGGDRSAAGQELGQDADAVGGWYARLASALAGATRRRGRVLSAYALAAAFTWINLAVRHAFHPDALALWAAPVEDAELWAYSGAWLLLGAALLGWGVRAGRRPARLAALALAGLASAKVFAVDMADLDGLWRVLSFGGLGLSLIGLSAFYRRVTATPRGTPGATTPRP